MPLPTTDADTEPETDPEADPDADPVADPVPVAEALADPEAEAEPVPVPDADPVPVAEALADPEAEAEPVPDADTLTDPPESSIWRTSPPSSVPHAVTTNSTAASRTTGLFPGFIGVAPSPPDSYPEWTLRTK